MTLLGKQADDHGVIDLLKELELDPRVTIKRGESDVNVNQPEKGLSLVFEAEDYVQAKTGKELLSDAPLFVGAFFFGPGHEDFSAYQGELIKSLAFSDGRDQAQKKLGASVEYDPDFNTEYWDLNSELRIFVDYSEDGKSIALIQLGLLLE